MYAVVTSDGFALDVVEGALDEAIAAARALGAHEVIFDESYDLSDLFTAHVEELERAANPTRKLRAVEEKLPAERVRMRRLSLLPDPEELSPEATKALDAYYSTGKFPKGLRQKVALEILRNLEPAGRLQAAGVFSEPDPKTAPQAAWAAAGKIKISMEKVMRLSVPQAFEAAIGPYRDRLAEEREVPRRWMSSRRFMTPMLDQETGLASIIGFLSTNHKLLKGSPVGAAHVMGLSLLPHKLWQLGFGGENPRRGVFNACIGASPECAQSCLVYSGQNTDDANDVKALRMDAFVNEPVAFARLLVEGLRIHMAGAQGFQQARWDEFVPFARLNVLSDLPWELMFPELFHHFKDLSFYDYTKVPGRHQGLADAGIRNYDLTFSWSGMNARGAEATWNADGKVAMVFFKVPQRGEWPMHEHWRGRMRGRTGVPMGPMPSVFLGKEVVDGDVTDVRPYDERLARGKRPWIIGLRYKPPKRQAFNPARALFIVPVEEHEETIYAAVVPRDQPGVMEGLMQEAADIMRLRRAEATAEEWAIRHREPRGGGRPLNPDRLRRRLVR